MALTAQQWATVGVLHDYLRNALNTMDLATGWNDYKIWALANGGYVPTDAEFADWQALTVADPIPTAVPTFLGDLFTYATFEHNEALP